MDRAVLSKPIYPAKEYEEILRQEEINRLARMLEAEDYGEPISVGKYTAILFLALLVFSFGMGAAYVADTVWTKENAAKLEQNAP